MGVFRGELVPHVGGDARLDSAGSEGNENEACEDRRLGQAEIPRRASASSERQRRLAGAIDERNPKNDPVFPKQPVGEDRSDHREQIDAGIEEMRDLRRVDLGLGERIRRNGRFGGKPDEKRGEVDVQDLPHAVNTETLGALIADNVRNAGGEAVIPLDDQ